MVNSSANHEMLAFLNTFDTKSIHLIRAKRFTYRPDILRQQHRHEFFEINYCRDGRTFFEVAGHSREYSPFDFNIIPPGASHGAEPNLDHQSESIIIWFDMKADLRRQTIIELSDRRCALAWLCMEIHEQYSSKRRFHEDIILSLLKSLMAEVRQYLVSEGNIDAIDYAINFLNDRLRTQGLRVADAASMVNMSVSQFSRKFRAKVGVSPRMFVIARRVEEAKRLLLNPELTISAIAGDLGYADAFYFSRQFHIATGLTPSEFRQASVQRPPKCRGARSPAWSEATHRFRSR